MARLEIVDGPSKWDLMLSLFDGDCRGRREVLFHLKIEKPGDPPCRAVAVVANKIEREDGSGENWLFRGYGVFIGDESRGGRPVHGFFSTRHRKGWVEAEKA